MKSRDLISRVLAGTDPRALVNVLTEQNNNEHPLVAFDMDGTILSYNDPDSIGEPIPGVIAEMRKIREAGWLIAIWTCRGNIEEVRESLDRFGVPYDFINENPHGPLDSSAKIFAHVYVDDRALAFDGKAEGLADRVTKFKPWYWR